MQSFPSLHTYSYFLILFFTTFLHHSHSQPNHFKTSQEHSQKQTHLNGPHQEYIEVSYPPPIHQPTPSCSHQILHHTFANTINTPPFSIPYSPPFNCPPPWTRVLLHFHAKTKDQQYDRIAAIWLAGVEILRTSTAQPPNSKIFWNVRKDITKYTSLLTKSNLDLTMMLENIVNAELTGVFQVTVTLLYYYKNTVRVPFNQSSDSISISESKSRTGSRSLVSELQEVPDSRVLNELPADLIIPISGDGKQGFWFRLEKEKDLKKSRIRIPRNTFKAVIELYVSFHGNDEFWYSNPPNSYITTNGLNTGRGNGAYREVYVTIDGEVVGSEIPFPVIFTGGINPLFWEPIVAIGAFNLPSYDIELTPFLGKILDGRRHVFGIGVTKGLSFWLVNANLHLWLDRESSIVRANRVIGHSPTTDVQRAEEFTGLDGEFQVIAGKDTMTTGWVLTSSGNITTVVMKGFTFSNVIKFKQNGTYKMVKQKFKFKKKVKVFDNKGEMISKFKVKRKYPLRVITVTEPYGLDDRYNLITNLTHGFNERYEGKGFIHSISNVQESKGWINVMGHSVISGHGSTKQNYSHVDKINCYNRNVASDHGRIVSDSSNFICENSL
ncbi:peptide-N(4)-(N-acetyl-beta-glucosaminyl)asparagine amidase [Trifolium pratense]|uniref:Peptide-N(4)-(N-acetyl-beta-glucosaminyl)asparagine amidase n=1 Tax=Trifolium pratense TaxID=57577 RepID=A0A2K3P5M5_TRIPR|nr:peptide-N(4)-(N-acetyl-beta-glucosaminyl)asparagine amidase [Trifolium pratense]